MNRLTNKPHQFTWMSIPLIILLSIVGMKSSIDLQLHDTYFVVATIHLGLLYTFIMGTAGFFYWLLGNKKLINWMTCFHITGTFIPFIAIIVLAIFFDKIIQRNVDTFRIINEVEWGMLGIIFLSQGIFLINILIGLIRKKRKI